MEQYGRRYNPSGEYKDDNGKTAYYKNQTDNYHQQHYQLFWNQILSQYFNLNVALYYTRDFGYYQEYKPDQKLYKYLLTSALGSGSDLINEKLEDHNFYGTVFSLNYKNNRLSSSLGGGWNDFDGDHYGQVLWVKNFSGSLDPDHEYYRNSADKKDGNVYAKVNYELIKGLNAYADMQYRRVDYKITGLQISLIITKINLA